MSDTAASWLRRRLPDLSAAISRFPLAVALAAAFTAYKLYLDAGVADFEARLLLWLAASFLWVVIVDFYAESRGRAFHARALLWVLGMAVLALLFWLDQDIWLSAGMLLASLALMVGLSGHLGRRETNATFWLFNHRLWLAALLGLTAAILLGAGLFAIHETLKFLFGIEFPRDVPTYIWTISLGFVAPVSALAFAPRSFTDPITPREEGEFTLRAVSALVKFVLVPLLLVYTAILYAYAIKIALAWELPKGTLGAMVTAYLLVGAATLLLGYPSRESGGVLVRFFWRYWMWLAALPVLLLFIAVFRRIGDYGMTQSRYLVVLVGIWALILAGLRIWRGRNLDLRLVPGVLAGLLLAGSFGPGGAIGLSVISQKAELGRLLTQRGILADGKLAPGSAEAGKTLPAEDAARVRAIEWYLNSHHALGLLAPWFEGAPDDPFAEGKTPEETARGVLDAFGLAGIDISQPPQTVYLNHYAELPLALDVPQGAHLVGPLMTQAAKRVDPESVAVDGLGTVEFSIDGNVLTARLENGGSVSFDLNDAVKAIKSKGWPTDPEHKPVELKGKSSGLDGTLLVESMTGNYRDPVFQLLTLRFWVLLAKPA
jgi:hypothetical protein